MTWVATLLITLAAGGAVELPIYGLPDNATCIAVAAAAAKERTDKGDKVRMITCERVGVP